MKSTDGIRIAALYCAISLSGCASFDKVFSESEEQAEQPLVAKSPTLSPSEPAVVDPMQQKLLALRAKPNLYLSGQSPVDSNTLSLFKQALQANQNGKPEVAARLYVSLTQNQPSLSGPWLQLGNLKMQALAAFSSSQYEQQQTQLNEAKAYYLKAISVNQHNYFAQNRLAHVFRELGEFEQAEQHYLQAIASWPGYDNSYLNLGILYDLYMGKKQQALEYYELYQALQDKPVRQVRGWIADLNRQLAQSSTAGGVQ